MPDGAAASILLEESRESVDIVELLVPISDATEWQGWMTDALSEEAHAAEAGYDGGEEEGRYESHLFTDTDPETVATIALRVLTNRAIDRSVTVTDADRVTVSSSIPSSWIVTQPLPGAYGSAVIKLCRKLNAHEQARSWLNFRGYAIVTVRQTPGGRSGKALFQEAPADGLPDELFMIASVDLSVYEEGANAGKDPGLLARENMRSVLDRLAAHLGSPLPEGLAQLVL